jgi:hypothetical protein
MLAAGRGRPREFPVAVDCGTGLARRVLDQMVVTW